VQVLQHRDVVFGIGPQRIGELRSGGLGLQQAGVLDGQSGQVSERVHEVRVVLSEPLGPSPSRDDQ
jgi:hypothetical protein